MKITFLGTGSAFCMKNYQTNLLIENEEKKLLVDAGGDIRWALQDQKLTYKDIDAIYITHGHADHIGGMEYLGFCTYFDPTCKKPILYGNKGLLDDVWNNALSLGLGSIQGKVVNLRDYFDVKEIEENESFMFGHTSRFKIVQSVHIMNGYSIVRTYGLMIRCNGKNIYITGDTQHCPNQIQDFYNQADTIIQDCETAPYKSGVHAHFDELCTLDEETKKKMYLVHYQDNVCDNLEEWQTKAIDSGFVGFAIQGQTIETNEI